MLEARDDGPANMTAELRRQHDETRQMATQLGAGDTSVLEDFGILLRDHTRMEERELFPIAEDKLTRRQLDEVLEQTQSGEE